jgi:hypothetical protein
MLTGKCAYLMGQAQAIAFPHLRLMIQRDTVTYYRGRADVMLFGQAIAQFAMNNIQYQSMQTWGSSPDSRGTWVECISISPWAPMCLHILRDKEDILGVSARMVDGVCPPRLTCYCDISAFKLKR